MLTMIIKYISVSQTSLVVRLSAFNHKTFLLEFISTKLLVMIGPQDYLLR